MGTLHAKRMMGYVRLARVAHLRTARCSVPPTAAGWLDAIAKSHRRRLVIAKEVVTIVVSLSRGEKRVRNRSIETAVILPTRR